ncbi:MAG: C10 family peptidase [Kiritimatiellia bacterium]
MKRVVFLCALCSELPWAAAAVGPLMSEVWRQEDDFNQFSPVVGGARAPCGCVGTAMAQMFHYYQWPRYTYGITEGTVQVKEDQIATVELAIDGHLPFDYAQMADDWGARTLPEAYQTSRFVLWIDALSRMMFDSGSGNTDYHFTADHASCWYEKGHALDPYDEQSLNSLIAEIEAGRPVQMTVEFEGDGGHQVVVDGYRLDGKTHEVHVNYGWADETTAWYALSWNGARYAIAPLGGGTARGVIEWWAGLAPKKTVQIDPPGRFATADGAIGWHLPAIHADAVEGFTLSDTTLTETLGDVDEKMSLSIAIDREGYYPLGTLYGIEKDSTLAVEVSSYYTRDIRLALEARANGGDWREIADVELSTKEDTTDKSGNVVEAGRLDVTVTPSLAAFAGQAAEFRLRTVRGPNNADNGNGGEYIACSRFALAGVRLPATSESTLAKSARSAELAGRAAGFHRFVVTPIVAGAIASESAGVEIVETLPPAPAIERIATFANPFADELVRPVEPGGIVLLVQTSSSVTGLATRCSHRSYIPSVDSKPLGEGWFLLTMSTSADVKRKSQMILTLDAVDADDQHALKEIVLSASENSLDDEEYLIGVVQNALVVPPGTTNTLSAASPRKVAGMGTVIFRNTAPSYEDSFTFGFTDELAWQGCVILDNIEADDEYAAYLKNGKSTLLYATVADPGTEEPVEKEVAASFDWTPGSDPSGWFTAWDGENVGSARTVTGPDGVIAEAMVVYHDSNLNADKWHPWKSSAAAKSAYTFVTYGSADMVTASAGKLAVLWCMGGRNGQKTALVKDENAHFKLVQVAGATTEIAQEIDAGTAAGYHLFTVRFDEKAGASLQIDARAAHTNSAFAAVAGDGFQVGSVLSGTTGLALELGDGFAVLRMLAYDDAELPPAQYAALLEAFPSAAVDPCVHTVGKDDGTVVIPAGAITGAMRELPEMAGKSDAEIAATVQANGLTLAGNIVLGFDPVAVTAKDLFYLNIAVDKDGKVTLATSIDGNTLLPGYEKAFMGATSLAPTPDWAEITHTDGLRFFKAIVRRREK